MSKTPYFTLIMLLLIFSGCATKDDVVNISQKPYSAQLLYDAGLFVKNEGALLDASAHKRKTEEFLKLHFSPWSIGDVPKKEQAVLWGVDFVKRNRLFGESKQPFTEADLEKVLSQLALDRFPNIRHNGITLRSVDARVLPTNKPLFLDFDKPGEGFPFDYMQNSQIHPMTPIRVRHLSRDGSWAYIESGYVGGWVETKDIAFLGEKETGVLISNHLVSVSRDGVPVYDEQQRFLFYANIGSLFALIGSKNGFYRIAVVVQDKNGWGVLIDGFIPKEDALTFPQSITEQNIAKIINGVLGVNYGWGGMYGNRDCSSMIRDIFVPFGIYLPRNSASQAKAWDFEKLQGVRRHEKLSIIRSKAKPFGTIFWKKGHVMLYLGEKEENIYIAHAFWGIRTKEENGKEGRYVVGKSAITTIDFGKTHPLFDHEGGDFLDSLLGMSTLR